MSDYDVIVLDTGGAGLTAAVTAAELGAAFHEQDPVAAAV